MSKPKISIGALGGTICMSACGNEGGVKPSFSAADLIAAVPALKDMAEIKAQTILALPSGSLKIDDLVSVYKWAKEQIKNGARGVVITQGTDTLEESAFFLNLIWDEAAPLVIITLEFAKNILRDQIKEKRENINLESIVEIVSKELNVKPSEMKSKSRSKNIVEARRIVIYLAKNLTPNSMPQIAQFFNMKDHSAVSHSIKKINELIETNEYFKIRVEELKNKILTKE